MEEDVSEKAPWLSRMRRLFGHADGETVRHQDSPAGAAAGGSMSWQTLGPANTL
jgi:hypothetical protein